MSYEVENNPQSSQKTVLFDVDSGVYRPLLNSDFGSSEDAVTTVTINGPNGQAIQFKNPLPIKLASNSASAFGEVLTVEQTPQVEAYLESAFDTREWEQFSGKNDGYVSVGTGMAATFIGNTILAYSTLRTKDFIPYIPGQGVTTRFTAAFNTGVANSLQLVGPYHAEDGFAVGYNGTGFGIMHRYGRKLEIQKLSFSTASDTPGNVTITLNGTPNVVPLHADGNIWDDARNISTGSFTENGPLALDYEWQTFQISGDTYFMRTTHGGLTGSMAFDAGSTNAVASFSQVQSGANGTQDWVYQTGFSYDVLDGSASASNPSSMNINPQKINIYQIKYGWLGSLPILFSIGKQGSQELVPFHTIGWTNEKDIPSLEDPRFPISYAVASAGSTTPISIKGASVYGAIEGKSEIKHRQFSVINEETADTAEDPILCIMNNRFNLRNSVINRRRLFIKDITITNESSTKAFTAKIYIGKKSDISNANFYSENIDSAVLIDKSSDSLSNGNGSLELIASEGIAPSNTDKVDISKFILPKEVLVITTQTSSSTAVAIVSVNGFEDV